MEKIKKYLGGKQEVATNKNKKIIKKALIIGVGVAAFVAAVAFGDEIGDIVSEWLDPNNFDTDIASSPASEYLNTSIGEDMGVCGTDIVADGSINADGCMDKSKISFGGAIGDYYKHIDSVYDPEIMSAENKYISDLSRIREDGPYSWENPEHTLSTDIHDIENWKTSKREAISRAKIWESKQAEYDAYSAIIRQCLGKNT